jgi:Cupin domain
MTEPGQGVPLRVPTHEDELVYVVDGQLEVTLGDQKMTATAGVLALLPRGIPRGFTNTGGIPSRLLDVILPGTFDNYFVALPNRPLGAHHEIVRVVGDHGAQTPRRHARVSLSAWTLYTVVMLQ